MCSFCFEIMESIVWIYCLRIQLITTKKTNLGDKSSNKEHLVMIQPRKYLITDIPRNNDDDKIPAAGENSPHLKTKTHFLFYFFFHWAIS